MTSKFWNLNLLQFENENSLKHHSNKMFKSTFVLFFWSVAMICEELTPDLRQNIIPLEEIADEKVLENWDKYKLGKMPKH